MEKIALPKKIEFTKCQKSNQKLVVIEPCFPGYGITLGNALRRVLLSSLLGAAVVGVKIKGADHEFMNLPHIKEDILEIIMNLKKLRLKIHGEEATQKLELDVHGEKDVKASNIKKNSQVEIINSDLTIATITDMAGNLNMEIFVSRGTGYETIEYREKEKHEIGYIELDSIFSPVLEVSINIENVRVGKMTNWDKLILNITTDGSITPEQAFKQATAILIDQFKALTDKKVDKDKKENETKDKEKKQTKEKVDNESAPTNIHDKKTDKQVDEDEKLEDKPKKKRGRPKKIDKK